MSSSDYRCKRKCIGVDIDFPPDSRHYSLLIPLTRGMDRVQLVLRASSSMPTETLPSVVTVRYDENTANEVNRLDSYWPMILHVRISAQRLSNSAQR